MTDRTPSHPNSESHADRAIPLLSPDHAEPADLVAAIRERRGGHLIELDRMLLHSAPLARGWNAYLKEIRQNLSIDAHLRELAILGVAVLNGAEYEFAQHAPVFLKAGGQPAQIDAIFALGQAHFNATAFSPLEQVVCELTLSMTRHIEVPPQLMHNLKTALGETATVELVAVVATYNMVSRFLVALKV